MLLLHLLEIGALFAFAQFLLDRLDLLVQVVLALALLHLALDAAADALFDLQDVELAFELRRADARAACSTSNISRTACFCSSFSGRCAAMVSARRPGSSMPGQRRQDFGRNLLVELHVLVELRQPSRGASPRLHARDLGVGRDRRGLDGEVRRRARLRWSDMRALLPSTSTFTVPSGSFSICRILATLPIVVHVFGRGLVLGRRFLRDEHDALAGFHRGSSALIDFGTSDEQRNHHMRETRRRRAAARSGSCTRVRHLVDWVS